MDQHRSKPRFEDCFFYHTIELPSRGIIEGPWDLRGREHEYLGRYPFAGKSVVEFGPASGGLTLFLERAGAAVTVFEASLERGVDILPFDAFDMQRLRLETTDTLRALVNSWWYVRHEFGLKARALYGNIYEAAATLERADVSILAAILLHLRSPVEALHQACSLAREAVIVTDMVSPALERLDEPICLFAPQPRTNSRHWWNFSPAFVAHFLRNIGFSEIAVTVHTQHHNPWNDMSKPKVRTPMFTVVGRKPG
jgi:O-methyltransferase